MINMELNTAGLKNEPIKEWRVLFHVLTLGITDTLNKALQACAANNLNPVANIIPVAAAITETEFEVVLR
jgi:hypothetical protein